MELGMQNWQTNWVAKNGHIKSLNEIRNGEFFKTVMLRKLMYSKSLKIFLTPIFRFSELQFFFHFASMWEVLKKHEMKIAGNVSIVISAAGVQILY